MHIRKFDLNLLPVFRALFLHGNVSRAALDLGLTQPAVSHALNRLRQHYGDPLFVRIRSRMEPTPRACELAGAINAGLEQIERAFGKPVFDPRDLDRAFNIGLVSYSGFFTLPALTEKLRFEAPRLQLIPEHMDAPSARERLLSGDIDMAMGVLPKLNGPFRQQRLLHSSFVAITRRGHPFKRASITLEEIGRHPHVRVPIFDHLDRTLSEHGVTRQYMMTCPSLLSVPFTVARSDLFAIIPSRLAMTFMHLCRLRIIKLPASIPPYDIALAYHRRLELEPGHEWMVQNIVALSGEIVEQLPRS